MRCSDNNRIVAVDVLPPVVGYTQVDTEFQSEKTLPRASLELRSEDSSSTIFIGIWYCVVDLFFLVHVREMEIVSGSLDRSLNRSSKLK